MPAESFNVQIASGGECFHLIFLPLYSPQLNSIERLWKWPKDAVIANVSHKDQKDIDQAIVRFMDYIL
nr:transposase [Parageobacillus thermoglucosidasius]